MIRASMASFWPNLLKANMLRSQLWGGSKLDLGFKLLEMIGEMGEWANEMKKLKRESLNIQGSRTTREKMLLELGDFMITQALVFNELGIKAHEIEQGTILAFNNKSRELYLPIVINSIGEVVDERN